MPVALDLTGKQFGYLKAIKKAESRSGKTYWLCECQLCGTLKEVQTCHLTTGKIISCGCYAKSNGIMKDTGKEKICHLCSNSFISKGGGRIYCYECSPEGLDSAARIKHLDRKVKKFLIEYKGGKCEKCGYDKCQGALQFHHLDPSQKEFNLSHKNFGQGTSIEELKKEVDKCILLCANCHFEEHYTDEE